jgi:hypothetical protein
MSTTFVVLFTNIALAQAPADNAVTADQALKAVEKSLPFLREEGVQWIRRRQCHSCHHVGFMIWSLNEARRHGLKVDLEELKSSSAWAVQYATYDATFYRLPSATLETLQKEGLTKEEGEKLQNIKQTFARGSDFREELVGALTKESLAKHEEALFKSAAITGQGGKGEDDAHKNGPGTVASELLMAGAAALTGKETDAAKALVERLAVTQLKDGSWKPGGQYNAFNRSVQESTEVVTGWNTLALIGYDGPNENAAKTRAQALAFLQKAKDGQSTEWHVVQSLLARALKETDRAEAALKELRAMQRDDGGWGWLKTSKQSDAYATGAALYALGVFGANNSDPSVAKAWSFLVKTQLADGDWLVPSGSLRKGGEKKSTDPIFSYWGTGWAALGILKTLPNRD